MKEEVILISGMTCQHCVKAVEKELLKLPLEKYQLAVSILDVTYDENKVSHTQIQDAIRDAGYDILNK